MKADKLRHARNGFRAIHTDYINNDQNQGFKVTFSNDTPPPPPPKRRLTETAFIRELATNSDIELI